MTQRHFSVTCKNCQNQYHGHYCPNCGQKATTKRLNFGDILSELLNAFTFLNRGILFSIKELSVRPGHSIREYVEGKRVNHFHPVNYLLLIGGVVTWVYLHFWDDIVDVKLLMERFGGAKAVFAYPYVQKALHFAFENYTYQLMLNMLVYGYFSVKIFGKGRYNFIEGLTLNIFLLAHIELIKLVIFPLQYFVKGSFVGWILTGIISSLLTTAYTVWVYHQFFEEKKVFRAALKALLVMFIASVLMGVLSGVSGFMFQKYVKF